MTNLNSSSIKNSVSYWDVERVSATANQISIKNSKIVNATSVCEKKIRIRAFHKGSWAYSSTDRPKIVEKLLERTCKAAIALGRDSHFAQKEYQLAKGIAGKNWKTPVKLDLELVSIHEKAKLLLSIEAAARNVASDAETLKTILTYGDAKIHMTLTTSEGVDELSQDSSRCGLALNCIAKDGGRMQNVFDTHRGTGGYEIIKEIDASAFAEPVAKRAIALLSAKAAPGGKKTVVLDPLLVGTFVHEALGHLAEADHVVNNDDILAGRDGDIIASPLVSIVDDKTLARGYGSFGFDRDGIASERTRIIEDGRLLGFLNSRTSGGRLGADSTGNCRGEFNQVRMSNTLLLGGDYSSTDEIIKETKAGVYLVGSSGGTTQPVNGYFNFGAVEGYIIENGELTTHLRDVSLLGNTLEILKTIDAIGKDVMIHGANCGKNGEWIPVGAGGPAIRTKAIVGGVA